MSEIMRPILEIAVIIPGMLLAYLPVKTCLRQAPFKLGLWMFPLLLGISLSGGIVCYYFQIMTTLFLIPVLLFLMLLYHKTLQISIWKSSSIFLAVCAVFACVKSLSRAVNAIMIFEPDIAEKQLWLCVKAGIFYNLICLSFVLIAWYPATHMVRILIADENFAQTWYIFWILPLIFIGLNQFMVPKYQSTLYTGRILQIYIVVSIVLLIILTLFYAIFLMMALSLNKNARLQQENHFLSLQRSRYDNLCAAIEETRQVRHDIRHHYLQLELLHGTLGACAELAVCLQRIVPCARIAYAVEPRLHKCHVRPGGAALEQGIITGNRHRGIPPFPPCYAPAGCSVTPPAAPSAAGQSAGAPSPPAGTAGCTARRQGRSPQAGRSRPAQSCTAPGTAHTTSCARRRCRCRCARHRTARRAADQWGSAGRGSTYLRDTPAPGHGCSARPMPAAPPAETAKAAPPPMPAPPVRFAPGIAASRPALRPVPGVWRSGRPQHYWSPGCAAAGCRRTALPLHPAGCAPSTAPAKRRTAQSPPASWRTAAAFAGRKAALRKNAP